MSALALNDRVDPRWRPARQHLPAYDASQVPTDLEEAREFLQGVDRVRCMAARQDVNAFIEYVLRDENGGYLEQQWFHEKWHAHLSEHKFSLIKAPRSHGKTTQIVAGRTIWRLGLNPSLRIKIVSESDRLAMDRLVEIRTIIETSPHLRAVFPDLVPAERSQWSSHRLNVAHAAIHRDASVEALGILSSATGGRADIVIADDPVGRRTGLQMPEMRNQIIRAWDSDWMQLLDPAGEVWYIATPWHPRDLTHEIERRGQFSILETAIQDEESPIWPDRWSAELLRTKRAQIGSVEFARAYQLRATGDDTTVIRPEWIQYFDTEEVA